MTRDSVRNQVVTGVVPPQLGEARIREVFPSVQAFPAVATLGRVLILSYIGAPLAWALMLPFYFLKILPFLARRYLLTNRRLMFCRGLKPVPVQEIALADIDEVRIVADDNSKFFRGATLEIVSQGTVKMTLLGVPEPESFRHSIINSCAAWVPGKAKTQGVFVPAKSS